MSEENDDSVERSRVKEEEEEMQEEEEGKEQAAGAEKEEAEAAPAEEAKTPDESKLYVANIGFETTESEIRELFAPFGEVKEVRIAIIKSTGKSRGFTFVDMETEEGGREAVQQLNGKEIQGRELKVQVCTTKPGEAKSRVQAQPRAAGGAKSQESCRNFARGRCNMGDRCKYLHDASEGSRGGRDRGYDDRDRDRGGRDRDRGGRDRDRRFDDRDRDRGGRDRDRGYDDRDRDRGGRDRDRGYDDRDRDRGGRDRDRGGRDNERGSVRDRTFEVPGRQERDRAYEMYKNSRKA